MKRKMSFGRFLPAVSLSSMLLMTACSHTEIGTADRHAITQAENAADAVYRGQLPLKPDDSNEEVSNGVWTGGRAIRADHGASLPYKWEAYGFTLAKPQQSLTLREISQKITQATGIPVTFAGDVFPQPKPGQATGMGGMGGAAGRGGGENTANLNSAISKLGLSQGGSANEGETFGDDKKMVLNFKSGPLSALLNEVCGYFGLTWKYENTDGGRIQFYRNVTRIYHINALPLADMSMSTGMTQDNNSAVQGTGTSSNSQSGSNNQKTTANISVKIWDDILGSVRTIISASGSDGWISASRSTGTLSVTAPAQVMDKIQNFIDTQNAILSKQVNLNVEVLSVSMTASDALTVDMKNIIGKFAMGYAGSAAISATADAGSMLGLTKTNNQFLIQELSKLGHVEVTTNTNVMTLNGIPAPIQVAHTRGYVAQVQTMVTSTSSSSSSNSQTTLTPGSVTFGFNMMILPEVMPGNDSVMLHFGTSLSDLNGADDGFDTFSSGNQTVQLVNIISRNFQQEAMVPNGHPVILSGFQQTNSTSSYSGTGKPKMIGLGGSQNGSETKTMIVIIVTPVVLSQQAISYSDSN